MRALVKEWMSGDPIGVEPEASALEALDLMVDRAIRHLPVLGASKRLVGVLSIDDLRAALPAAASPRKLAGSEREALRHYTVGELMTFAPFTVREDAPLEEAVEILSGRRIGCLPVVEDGDRLVGILSETDALHALATALSIDRARSQRGREAEVESLVGRLRAERDRIVETMAELSRTERTFATHVGEEPIDFGERAADVSEVQRAEAFHDLAARRLAQLDRALERAGQARLGVCERCARPIPVARLQALPGTTLCVACARAQDEAAAR